MKEIAKITAVLLLMLTSTFTYAQIPEEIQWKHLLKTYNADSSDLTLSLNGKNLNGKYKIPLDEKSYALYTIKNGMITGDAFWYTNGGHLECKLVYKRGVRNGLKENYDHDGKVWLRQEYKDGKQDGLSEMYSNGQLNNKSEYKKDKKDGKQLSYSSGKVLSETEYKDGLRDGMSKTYGLDGKPVSEINYKADKQDGLTTMYAMGNKTMDFVFKGGKKHGIGHMYKPDGSLVFTSYYLNGEKVSKDEFEKSF
ncbi:toxin-antitoxin system YwqK family antitoxin [Pedobacter petrophilus]|uniref:Toxin-antitoxin system YwqK family antitoxin n=1 Tax=Pedobacter petrophilus TaxID=1908241 RepID=A0A7K0G6F4_9SPHI|nr:toxin-antitoxin system YwqK family antitoxin [Pedobacter petrophilus]MRX78944.1 toxin-antitoxin system YwqK family antitoxin [Pedobacter petrophilus]